MRIEETLAEKVDQCVMMAWTHRKDGRGGLAKKVQSSYCGRSPEERKAYNGVIKVLAIREVCLQQATKLAREREVCG